jgi:hypothetical protein
MMDESRWIKEADWLQHRWAVEIRKREMQAQVTYLVCVGGCELSSHGTAAIAKGAANRLKPISLEAMVGQHPEYAGGMALIEGYSLPTVRGENPRLARIPPRLWNSYDALFVARHAQYLTLISAKARAMFPRHMGVFVRVYPASGRR